MKPKATAIPPAGELRLNQVITTFGPGAMIDLPERAAIIGGLDSWHGTMRPIFEERLERRLREMLSLDRLSFKEPPVDLGTPNAPQTGVDAFLFPTWFLGMVPDQEKTFGGRVYRTRPLVRWDQLTQGKYFGEDRKKYDVVPVRFVQACIRGHISDLDWYGFVREDPKTEHSGPLMLDEGGAGNDFSEIFVRCERTGRRRPLSQALVPGARILGTCRGRQPWLGPRVFEPCTEPHRLLTRSASNAYFAQTMSVISIPDAQAELRQAVDTVWTDFLQYVEGIDELRKERRREKVANALSGFSDESVWAEIQRRTSGSDSPPRSIKQAEIETLLTQTESEGGDVPNGDFYARARSLDKVPEKLRDRIDRIVLVHRLREVTAQLAFTRFEASLPDIDGELDLGVRPAPLAREITWLPAVENKGEGIFLSFRRPRFKAGCGGPKWWSGASPCRRASASGRHSASRQIWNSPACPT